MFATSKIPKEIHFQKKLHYMARQLRARQTPAEEHLWKLLKAKNLLGLKFLRQHPIDRYIVDFICYEKKLIIEVDGEIHDSQKDRDENRDKVLNNYGFTVLRFTNEEVLFKTSQVLKTVTQSCSLIPSQGRRVGEERSGEYYFNTK